MTEPKWKEVTKDASRYNEKAVTIRYRVVDGIRTYQIKEVHTIDLDFMSVEDAQDMLSAAAEDLVDTRVTVKRTTSGDLVQEVEGWAEWITPEIVAEVTEAERQQRLALASQRLVTARLQLNDLQRNYPELFDV